MSVLAPWALAAGALAALAVVALHFLARRRPRPAPFPTARFIPEGPAVATRALRPTDLPLLALRVAAVLLLSAAFARPVPAPHRRGLLRIVAVDRSRAVASAAESLDSARALLRPGDVLISFDSAARVARDVSRAARATPLVLPPLARATGSLSAALAAAVRARGAAMVRADSVELVLISPFARAEWDAATLPLRRAWPGRVRLVRVAARADSVWARSIGLESAGPDDPLRATLALMGSDSGAATVRVQRGAPGTADSAWARAGGVLVLWPASGALPTWPPRGQRDTTGAVVTNADVVVASFVRGAAPPSGQAVAWWVDGRPAATERQLGAGCVRSVAVALPTAGDLALRPEMRGLVRALAAPCGAALARARGAADARALAALRGEGALARGERLAAASLAPAALLGAPVSAWLLGAAALLLVVEGWLRRRRDRDAHARSAAEGAQ